MIFDIVKMMLKQMIIMLQCPSKARKVPPNWQKGGTLFVGACTNGRKVQPKWMRHFMSKSPEMPSSPDPQISFLFLKNKINVEVFDIRKLKRIFYLETLQKATKCKLVSV